MDNFETMIVVTAALATCGLCVTGFVGWWVNGTVQTGTEDLRESTDELRARLEKQSESLTAVSTELHAARVEVTRVHSQVGALRAELESFVHGPPSLRAPPAGLKKVERTEKTP